MQRLQQASCFGIENRSSDDGREAVRTSSVEQLFNDVDAAELSVADNAISSSGGMQQYASLSLVLMNCPQGGDRSTTSMT